MKRDPKAYLFDIREAVDHIIEFTGETSPEEFLTNELIKAAVERKFAIIGEALMRIRDEYPEILAQITDSEKIIGFRNVLVHGYDIIDPATVWSAITKNLPVLSKEVSALLQP
ncbi:DUF86 domain-containing protein [bacterium]|nr:DUF86 domain-containing protein [bacterium]MBU1652023.1 DUF86 domain-containing protein [bacterium]